MLLKTSQVRWWVPAVAVLGAWLLALTGRCAAQVNFNQATLDSLGSVADTATIEHAACLLAAPTGGIEMHGDTAVPIIAVNTIYWPEQAGTPMAVAHAACPYGTVVGWHNHIPAITDTVFKKLGWDSGWDKPEWVSGRLRGCAIGQNDIFGSLRETAPMIMVHVDKSIYCWYTREQLLQNSHRMILWPYQQQISTLDNH